MAVGLGLLALAALRGAGLLLLAGTVLHDRWRAAAVLGVAALGLLAVAAGGGASWSLLAALAIGLGLAAVGLVRRRVRRASAPLLAGLLAGALVMALARVAVWALGPRELANGLFGSADVATLRLALVAATWGLLRFAGGRRRATAGGRPWPANDAAWGWAAVLLALLAGAVPDHPWAVSALLTLGGGAAARWLAALPSRLPLPVRGATLLVAAVFVAGAWECAARGGLRAELPAVLAGFVPPDAAARRALAAEVSQGFTGRDLAEIGPAAATRDRQDLAEVLWRRSPLARTDALSALVVEPLAGGPSAAFAYGLPLLGGSTVDLDPGRWPGLLLPGWQDAMVRGEATLELRGKPWARLGFWLLPRPGFGRAPAAPRELGASLLRGEAGEGAFATLPSGVLLALFRVEATAGEAPGQGPAGERLVPLLAGGAGGTAGGSERVDAGLLPAGLLAGAPASMELVDMALAAAVSSRDGDLLTALLMPRLSLASALERLGTHALGAMLVLAALAALALPLALGRETVRDAIRRGVRSYSRRLVLVTTALALLPLALLNVLLLQGVESRLERQQLRAGEGALASAQQVLGEYLSSLEPGYGLDTALDERLVSWLARVVHHEVNLYWGSRLYRSSRQELFASGLLPRRIPGEVYARLALGGEPQAARTNRLTSADRNTAWVELYAPLRLPGLPADQKLFVSVPLLAQQAEVASELAAERRRALLITTALFLLLIAVSLRLAASFAKPVTELVEGTRRIAAGAAGLGLLADAAAPREPELAELVRAVDDMARRIAAGREQLLREKQVVERVVENITAGVVSLDGDGRVVMHNRVAAELLGVRGGEQLAAHLAGDARLAPVGAFLAAASDPRASPGARQSTVVLPPAGAELPEQDWTLVWVPLPGAGGPTALLVVEDTTEVLRGQRLLAWAEMARIIAHEVKNPLTPIRLSAEHLREVRRRDPAGLDRVFDRCIDNILRHVEELRETASEFSIYSQLPRLEREPGDLVAAVADVVAGYQAAPPPGVRVEFCAEPSALTVRFDRRLLGRAVRNLLENAVRASSGVGGGAVEVRVDQQDSMVRVVVRDEGPGVPPDQLARIFEPYFSTHAGGTGLGLPIAQRIAVQHGGGIEIRNRAGGGLEAVLTVSAG